MIKITASHYGAVVASILGFAVLTGCKKPTTDLGLDFAQEDLLGLHQTDTLALSLETVREDSLETSHLSTAVLGNMEHPFFGLHHASFIAQLRLSAPDIDFGSNPVVDSIYLSLNYTGDRYGQLGPQYIRVEQLVDTISLGSDYYSNQIISTTQVNLADPAFQPVLLNPRENLFIAGDTVAPEVRVYLDNAFGQSLLEANSSIYDSNQAWQEYFPGLLIAPDPNGPGQGAVGIDVLTGLSRMRLHYHSDTDSSGTYDFSINALSPRINLFTHQWYPPFQALDEAYITTLDGSLQAGVFSGAGLKTRVQFPGLSSWESERADNRAVHKAELWLPVDPYYNDPRYPIPSQLFILSENEEGEAVPTPDQTSIGLAINGNYDSAEKAYRFNISQTFQQMLNGTYESDKLYVVSSRAGVSLQGVMLNGPAVQPLEGDTTGWKPNARLVVTWSE
ncbi:MAG: hypothetical protein CMD33_09150 [Flavobacteriales bacterium]|nr:hypothetical protein [Flavobacteriales bacterium]